jgi:hypothetical protein
LQRTFRGPPRTQPGRAVQLTKPCRSRWTRCSGTAGIPQQHSGTKRDRRAEQPKAATSKALPRAHDAEAYRTEPVRRGSEAAQRPMGTTCSRRRSQETRNVEEHDGPSEDEGLTSSSEDEARQRWQLLTHGARRLAFKRREWAYLGHQLADIKRRGRRGV